ncbi:hypothetical protein [Actinokineospora sp. NPDC004072]
MRLVRIGEPGTAVGADVRAALAAWGQGGAVLGGVALIGVRPPGCPRPIDAVVVLPRGVVVVSGVDLPDPAVRLEAPLGGGWKTDGWPLVRPDAGGSANPGAEALAAGAAVTERLQAARVEPLPVGVVIAVGPYVKQVVQPTADLVRGVRILHPEPLTLLTAARELAGYDHPCAAPQAMKILEALHPQARLGVAELVAEGFPETAPAAATTFIPKSAVRAPTPAPRGQVARRGPRWLPVAAAALVVLLLVVGVVLAIGSGDSASQAPPQQQPRPAAPVGVDGVAFTEHGTTAGPDCAAAAYGDVRAWLERNRCDEVVRVRYAATAGGDRAAVLVAVLRFAASATAAELRAVAEQPGTGGVRDVNGAWPDGLAPAFDSAVFVTGREGNSVKVVQAVWLDKPSDPADPDLRGIADRALRLAVTG